MTKAIASRPVVVSSSEEGEILDVNRSFTEVTGFAPEEVVSKKATEIKLWKDPAVRDSFVTKVMHGEDVINQRVIILAKDGTELDVLFSMLAINDGGHSLIVSIAYSLDCRGHEENLIGTDHRQAGNVRSNTSPGIEAKKRLPGGQINLRESANVKLALPTSDGLEFIRLFDIMYFKASGNYTEIFLVNGKKHLVSKLLHEYEEIVRDYNFFRIHNSTLVQLNYIDKYVRHDGGYVVMTDNTLLALSRRKRDAFLECIGYKFPKDN